MIHYALIFLIDGLIVGSLALAGVSAAPSQVAWILLVIGTILLLLHLGTAHRTSS